MPIVEQSSSGYSVRFAPPVRQKPLPAPVKTAKPHEHVEQFIGPVEVVRKEVTVTVEKPPTKKEPAYRSFQVIPHAALKNDSADRFADVLANSYREVFERWDGMRIEDPDRVFFETVIEPSSFKTYITTSAPLHESVKSHVKMTWKCVTLIDAETPQVTADKVQCIAYDIRLKRPTFLSLKTDKRMQEKPLSELAEIGRSMQEGDRVMIQFGFQSAEDSWGREAEKEMGEFLLKHPWWWRKKEISSASRMKPSQDGYDFALRVLVTSLDERRRKRLARGVVLAFKQLDDDNELHEKQPLWRKRFVKRMECRKISVPLFQTRKRHVLTRAEIAHFVKFPQRALQEEYGDLITAVSKPETTIAECFANEDGVYVGTATYRDQKVNVHLPTENTDMLMTARAFMGSPRQGKDQAIINLIVESKMKHGIGAIIPDWIDERGKDEDGNWRGMANAIRDALPADEVIDIDWSDFDNVVPFGLGAVTQNISNSRIAADRIAKELTTFIMGDDIENHMTREYLRDAAKACAGDLLDIRRLFTDTDFRKEKIEEMERTGIGDAEMWRQFDEDLSNARRAQIFSPVNVRLGEILNDEVLAPIFCQRPNPNSDLRKWMEEGKVVILRIPTGSMSELTVSILAYFVIMVVFLVKLSMNGIGALTWLVLNEPHQVQTPGLVHFIRRVLAEGPKYLLAPIFAFHYLGQLQKDFADTLVSSSLSWHLFYNSNIKMYETLKAQIEPFAPDTALKETQRFHYIAAGWRDSLGEMQSAFMVKAPEPVKKRWGSHDNAHLTKEHAKKYGRPIDEVLDDIKQRTRRVKREKGDKKQKASA